MDKFPTHNSKTNSTPGTGRFKFNRFNKYETSIFFFLWTLVESKLLVSTYYFNNKYISQVTALK